MQAVRLNWVLAEKTETENQTFKVLSYWLEHSSTHVGDSVVFSVIDVMRNFTLSEHKQKIHKPYPNFSGENTVFY